MNRKVAVVIDSSEHWREIFADVLREAEFAYFALTNTFVDDEEATVFIVASLSPSGQVVGPEYVSRFREAHPEALIIGVSADLKFVQLGVTMTVEQQFLAAGADHVVGKATFTKENFIQLLS